MPPGGGPPGLHRHAAAEVYRVERGELTLYVEDDDGALARVVAGPGSVVPIRGGREHTIRNEGRTEACASVVFAPGAEIERFLRAAAGAPADPAAVAAVAARHGIEMTRPLPGAQAVAGSGAGAGATGRTRSPASTTAARMHSPPETKKTPS
jgi:Cupin domain